ncbi:MAG: gliding motility-associated C-terminal domain-containing protein [Bacteroidia bacterium]
MKHFIHTLLLLTLFYTTKAQMLFYQNTYKGGVTSDGVSYYGYDYLQPDTINFQTHVAAGSTIKKAFLLSWRFNGYIGHPPTKDTPIELNYNNHFIQMDSSDIATTRFICKTNLDENYIIAKDVTVLTQQANNKLIIPDQNATITANSGMEYLFDGFLLVIMYENTAMASVNAAIYLNNNMLGNNLNENINSLNPINTANDVGLSIWTDNAFSFPSSSTLSYTLSSSLGNFTLGTLDQFNGLVGGSGTWKKTLPGSFYYENNTLHGLVDDSPDAFIDSTDALANIKTCVANSITSFSLISVGNNQGACEDSRLANILAYSTPCPARSNKDTVVSYSPICSGSSMQINNTNASIGTYTWSASNNSLNNYNIPDPIANTTITTNYIALIDSAGCKHTEHFKVNVYTTPKTDSVTTTVGICGSSVGTATIVCNIGSPSSYTVNGIVQSTPSFTNLTAGTYTFALNNNFGCKYASPKPFTIKDTNLAKASFYLTPDSGCAPLTISTINSSNYQGNVTNNYVWYVNNDSSLTQNLNYVFTDTGKYTITLLAYENIRSCSATTTKTISVNYCPPDSFNIVIPNVFSPNGDDINEVWQIITYNLGYTINNYQCTIYDRWGIKVFETNSINQAWDGKTTSGLSCSDDTYFYVINLTATNSIGKSEDKNSKGFIQLIK